MDNASNFKTGPLRKPTTQAEACDGLSPKDIAELQSLAVGNMEDRELLELAAKAFGIELMWSRIEDVSPRRADTFANWNPLTDDGDALRLAVKLNIELRFHLASDIPAVTATCIADSRLPTPREPWGDDKGAATRRAIVRVAAAIGQSIDNG